MKDWRVIFRTVFAEVPAGNAKSEGRYFLLRSEKPVEIDKGQKTCLVQFEYRPLSDGDIKQYKVKTKDGEEKKKKITQDELNAILKDKILGFISEIELKSVLSEIQGEMSNIERHLYKYTRKITSDFFIHKNLKAFLERELDYFIKTEVIDLNNLEPKHITRVKVVEGIAKRIIEFLSQIEEFQKMLWEKKKFVLKTQYVITIDRIPVEFHKEIFENKSQLREWKELGFGKIKGKRDMTGKRLPVDTKYFDDSFKERLLEKLSEKGGFDDMIDGILIKSENWQALNLLLGKYKEEVQMIYIDPPFNTGVDFLYKDKYQDSSWITLLENRLMLAEKILKNNGSMCIHLNEDANYYGRSLLSWIFKMFINEIIWSYISGGIPEKIGFARKHNTIFLYGKSDRPYFKQLKELKEKYSDINRDKIYEDEKGKFVWYIRPKTNPDVPKGVKTYIEGIMRDVWEIPIVNPQSRELMDFRTQKPEHLLKRILTASSLEKDVVLDFFLGIGTTTAVAHKFGRKWIGIEMGNHFNEFYFDKGERKTGILGRMKEVLAGYGKHEPCGVSKELKWHGGGFFKYHYLEQYEDTLHNIEFPNEEKGKQANSLFKKDDGGKEYFMRYFLKYETEGSPSLLNLKQFENPFEYKLKVISGDRGEEIVNVDLVETFNYLIGLHVSAYKFLKENGRKYVFTLGMKSNKRVAIVWRATQGLDPEKDKKVIEKVVGKFNPDEVFINGDAFYPKGYKVIETEFRALMGV